MNKDFDEAIAALMDDKPALAILYIEKALERRINAEAERFELRSEQVEPPIYEKPTDFLNFNGWEAA